MAGPIERGTLLAAGLMIAATTMTLQAQSLADVARKEAERRGTVSAKGRVFTNDNIRPDPHAPPAEVTEAPDGGVANGVEASVATTAEAAAAAAAALDAGSPLPAADQDGVTPSDEQEPQPASDKDEGYWRGRATTIRTRLEAQNRQIEQLRTRLVTLNAGSPTPETAVAERALAKALEDQRFLQEDWTRFERTARDRGVPEDWIR